ncbi:PROTEIN putative-RELATED [Salix purpurea]|uniref:PROTEIN putative-RELATED n=1 Tax=Salix purpurea TaxID=77065 RepID=A0A9Q0YW15_SALPP|nr:PROTEIN putative-RELATED [Salix purpurea]
MNLRCPPAIVAARAALARTALVKNLRPQPLPAKMLVIALLGMAVNVPLGMWKEHTEKFSLQWFAAVHAAVPFIAMLRKSVLMPKTAMALTIGASILGQIIGSRAERRRLKTVAIAASVDRYSPGQVSGNAGRHCGTEMSWDPFFIKTSGSKSSTNASLVIASRGGLVVADLPLVFCDAFENVVPVLACSISCPDNLSGEVQKRPAIPIIIQSPSRHSATRLDNARQQ